MSGVKTRTHASPGPGGDGLPLLAKEDGVLVYVVSEVYIYIPTELSAAGFELKIAGSIKIKDSKVGVHGVVRIN